MECLTKMTKGPKLKWGGGIPEDSKSVGSGDVFMKKPRAGAYHKYIKLKNIVYEES